MSKKNNQHSHYKEILSTLEELHKAHPSESLGQHLSLALCDYPDLFTVSDRELLFAFQKYQAELELDIQDVAPAEYVKKIEEDASHLFDKNYDDEDSWEQGEDFI